MTKRGCLIGLSILVVLVLFRAVLGCFYTVHQTKQVIITQFGKPVDEPITEPGLHLKLPFIQEVNEIDKRFLEWDGSPVAIPTRDKTYIHVDTYARWRIRRQLRRQPKFLLRLGERDEISRLRLSARNQPHVRLVDQPRRVERLPRFLAGHLCRGEPAQLVVHQRQQLGGGVRVAVLGGGQQAGDVGHGPHRGGDSGNVTPR